jgi:hypothetical protein
MSFATGYLSDPNKVQGGESYNEAGVDLSATVFENGLKVGRFAKLEAGSVDNLDGSVTPLLVGVIKRDDANAVEDGGTIDSDLCSQISYRREGLISVDVVPGTTAPALGARVEVSNAGDANDGLAIDTGGADSTAEFIEEITTNVWLVRLGAYAPA